jgi:hypothetical protein
MVARWRGVKRKKAGGSQASAPRGGENREERGGPGRGGGQLGRPTSTPGRRAWAAQLPRDRGGRRGATTQAWAADRWGRATPGPGGSDWVREGARASGAARRGALTNGPRPQCRAAALANRRARAAQCRAARILTGFKNISNGFKILQTLTNPKGVFPCSKN